MDYKKLFAIILKIIKKFPVICSIILSMGLGFIVSVLYCIIAYWDYIYLDDILTVWFLYGAGLIYPAILTIINLAALFIVPKDVSFRKALKRFEYMTLFLGTFYSLIFIAVSDIVLDGEWMQQLYNHQIHQPVWSGGLLTVAVLCGTGIVGYLILSFVRLEKTPPLILVLAMAAMYLGIFQCFMWCVQITNREYWVLSMLPINCIIIAMKTIRYKIREWNNLKEHEEQSFSDKPVLHFLNHKMRKAEYWPIIAFILMWPLLGIILCVLMLFGQKPDYVIKAWTETAQWRLSKQTAPPNLYYDEHYLCTVAAGGHSQIVKPIRMGERHGHRVVVNRQLCIANAFEQILEEKTPGFHRIIRHIYDTYGFPVAKLIKTKGAADVVYLLMKPLEWLFLIVIYLCDAKPENRIAVQYLPVREKGMGQTAKTVG